MLLSDWLRPQQALLTTYQQWRKHERQRVRELQSLSGDRLIVNGKRYTFDKIQKKNGVDTAKAELQGDISDLS